MMELFEALQKRYSYRGRYLQTPVPREHLLRILEAGLEAPSGCNKQTTSLIAVDDPELIKRITAPMEKPDTFATAPAGICVLTKQILAYRDRTYFMQDYSAAIQNMLLAITALGYASCWVEGHITDVDRIGRQMGDMLGVPQDVELVAYLPVGVPAEEKPRAAKLPFNQRMWFNGYGK